jgi:hypothetical protein
VSVINEVRRERTHDRVLDTCRCGLVSNLDNVVDPIVMLLKSISRDSDDFYVPREELGLAVRID